MSVRTISAAPQIRYNSSRCFQCFLLIRSMMELRNQFIARPVYLFITILLGSLGISSVVTVQQAGDDTRAWVIGLLFLMHIGLYWWNIRQPKSLGWWIAYYAIHTGIIVMLSLVLNRTYALEASIIGSTCLCLIGESLGWWGNTRTALLLGMFYFILAVVLLALLNEPGSLPGAIGSLFINGSVIVLLLVLFNKQLIERQRAVDLAESLESANAKLAASAARIEALTVQHERQRMARELHDTLAQDVAGLVLQLEAVKAHLSAGRTERAAAIVEQAAIRARSTLSEARAAIDDLRAAPDDLAAALAEKVDRFTQATGIPCRMDIAIEPRVLRRECAAHMVHIVNEALANIARHAQAGGVSLICRTQSGFLELDIRDDGKGFDPNHALQAGHYGLLGMRERARLLGGTLHIESSTQGTLISVRVPSASGAHP